MADDDLTAALRAEAKLATDLLARMVDDAELRAEGLPQLERLRVLQLSASIRESLAGARLKVLEADAAALGPVSAATRNRGALAQALALFPGDTTVGRWFSSNDGAIRICEGRRVNPFMVAIRIDSRCEHGWPRSDVAQADLDALLDAFGAPEPPPDVLIEGVPYAVFSIISSR